MFAPMHGTCTNTTEAYLSSFLKTEASYLLLRYVQFFFNGRWKLKLPRIFITRRELTQFIWKTGPE
jgi:hypothetical protein